MEVNEVENRRNLSTIIENITPDIYNLSEMYPCNCNIYQHNCTCESERVTIRKLLTEKVNMLKSEKSMQRGQNGGLKRSENYQNLKIEVEKLKEKDKYLEEKDKYLEKEVQNLKKEVQNLKEKLRKFKKQLQNLKK